MKIAIVHDWLTGMRGGERCLEMFLRLYPKADLFTLLHIQGATSQLIDSHVAGVSCLQNLPCSRTHYRYYLPIYPLAAASLDLSGYDVIISLSHAAAKNVRVPKGAIHLCYCFTPMRYLWDQAETYFGKMTIPLYPVLSLLRFWDQRGARGVTHFAAISKLVASRIRRFYGRESEVVHPAIEDSWFQGRLPQRKGEAFLYAGALVPYKRVDLIIEACNVRKVPLWIVGTGPQEAALKAKAGNTVQFFGRVDDQQLRQLYKASRALLFAAKEDFGLIPIECQSVGRPVIGFFDGGLKETVNGIRIWDGKFDSSVVRQSSGIFVRPERAGSAAIRSFVEGLDFFLKNEDLFNPAQCRSFALNFSQSAFIGQWNAFLRSRKLFPLCVEEAVDVEREAAPL
jgi:glycosyltransferase involved in cell wall biosynthesis